jgi:hypothetical protein
MVAASVVNAISDFLVVLIPIPVVLKLKMRYRQRAIVIGLFATGFVVCIVAIVRTVFTVILISPGHYDYTWDSFPVYICSALEMYLAIVILHLPIVLTSQEGLTYFRSALRSLLLVAFSVTTGRNSSLRPPRPAQKQIKNTTPVRVSRGASTHPTQTRGKVFLCLLCPTSPVVAGRIIPARPNIPMKRTRYQGRTRLMSRLLLTL